ncbi:unnamed protein product [Bursaphelenchus xylophilus]|uniref:(pine wood nematode) hypothetical protein n=1 Tax=Bursaphelenchus xylophilus TaxID=6326 RepID=A0A1I7SRN5_BURXY|nr:unnamed protein product [Bursaphelenchus xylophilus]CAG9102075.1 unnamed protein product [Bursaphelenchus xylophilus]
MALSGASGAELSRNTEVRHAGRKRLIRWILRRRPCRVLMIVSAVLILLLSVVVLLAVATKRGYTYTKYIYDLEGVFAAEKMDRSTGFVHEEFCLYEPAPKENVEFCNGGCGNLSLIFRTHFLRKDVSQPILCNPRLETHECYVSIGGGCINRTVKLNREQACGSGPRPLWEDYVNGMVTVDRNLTPIITNENLKKYANKTVLAHQLVARCPVCTRRFQPFKLSADGDCMMKFHKSQPGFPEQYNTCGPPKRDKSRATKGRGRNANKHNFCPLIE